MEPITIGSLAKAVKYINDAANGAKFNKKQCLALAKEARMVFNIVEQMPAVAIKMGHVRLALDGLGENLRSAKDICSKYSKKNYLKRLLYHNSHSEEFSLCKEEIHKKINIFNMAIGTVNATATAASDEDRRLREKEEKKRREEEEELRRVDAEETKRIMREVCDGNHKVQEDSEDMRRDLEELREIIKSNKLNPDVAPAAFEDQPPHHLNPARVIFDMKIKKNKYGGDNRLKLGDGGFGTVFSGSVFGRKVAVKEISISAETDVKKYDEETALIHKLSHPNVIDCLGICVIPDDSVCWIVYEIMETDLQKFMYVDKGFASIQDKFTVISHITRALSYLHSVKVTHRDLKPENVMRAAGSSLWKLIDFGMATARRVSSTNTYIGGAHKGTAGYMAPELTGANSVGGNHKVDNFAFGILANEIWANKKAFVDAPSTESVHDKVRKGFRPDIPCDMPPQLRMIVISVWSEDPEERMEMSAVSVALDHMLAEGSPTRAEVTGHSKNPLEWTVDEVCDWLSDLKVDPASFRENDIDGALLLELDDEILREDLEISKKLSRKRILVNISKLFGTKVPGEEHDTRDAEERIRAAEEKARLEAEEQVRAIQEKARAEAEERVRAAEEKQTREMEDFLQRRTSEFESKLARQQEAQEKALAEAEASARAAKEEAEMLRKKGAEHVGKNTEVGKTSSGVSRMDPDDALQNFAKVFGNPAASFVNDGHFYLDKGKCQTIEKARAVAGILSSNANVDKWNLEKGIIALYSNEMGDEAASIILNALKDNHTVKWINLHNNKLTDAIAPAVESVLKANKHIERIYLYANSFSDDTKSALKAAGGKNAQGNYKGYYRAFFG